MSITYLPEVINLGVTIRLYPCSKDTSGTIESPPNVTCILEDGTQKEGYYKLLKENEKETVYISMLKDE